MMDVDNNSKNNNNKLWSTDQLLQLHIYDYCQCPVITNDQGKISPRTGIEYSVSYRTLSCSAW